MCWSTCALWLTHEQAQSEKYIQIMDMFQHSHSSYIKNFFTVIFTFFYIKDFKREIHQYCWTKFSNISAHLIYYFVFFFICITWLYSLNRPDLRCRFFRKQMLKFHVYITRADCSEVSKVFVDSCLVWNESKSLLEWGGVASQIAVLCLN